jgi:hypothetical protein
MASHTITPPLHSGWHFFPFTICAAFTIALGTSAGRTLEGGSGRDV